MKTPDEIKKGLECCSGVGNCFGECPYYIGNTNIECIRNKNADALAYIQQLEAENEAYKHAARKCCYESRCNAQIKELETLGGRLMDEKKQLERERDALLKYITDSHWAACDICKHDIDGSGTEGCNHIRENGIPFFEWRGVKEE